MRYTFFILFALLCLTSCKDEQTLEDPNIDYGYDYFPLVIGAELTYRVDSIIYDPNESTVTTLNNTVYIKEVVLDTFQDEVGRLSFRIERYEKPKLDTTWTLTDIWSALKTTRQAERFEENLRFIKMVFPVDDGDLWNGIAHLDPTATYPIAGEQVEVFKSWSSEVIDADQIEQVGDFAFDQVTTIQLADEENLLERRYGIEKYAEGVGLVFQEIQIYDTQKTDAAEALWEEKAEKGFRMIKTLIDYK